MVTFNDADEFFETAAQGGNAFRLTDIDGIGPATKDKIMAVREINSTDDVKDMSADELADKANISRSRAKKAISGLGGNPSVSKRNKNTGSVSAAGMRTRQGDFWVEFTDMDKARARNDAQSRSEEAVRMDEKKRAPITTDLDQWKSAPGRWDYPGVDTPTQDPGVRPKDYKAGGEFDTAEFDDEGRAEYDEPDETYPRKKPAASGKENFILETGEERLPASEFSKGPEGENMRERRMAQTFLASADVPASSEEVFKGTNVGSIAENNIGGPTYNAVEGRPVETDRPDRMEDPPATALQNESDNDSATVEFPEWTISRGKTYLNEKVYGEEREDLRPLREKISRANPGQPLQLDKGEYDTFQRVVREEAKEEIERAEGMEANIFGDTDEQAEAAEKAIQGIINNPPDF